MKKLFTGMLVVIMLFAFIAVSFWEFATVSRNAVNSYGENYLEAQVRENAAAVQSELADSLRKLNLMADSVALLASGEQTLGFLEAARAQTSFDAISVAGADGMAYTTLEKGLDISKREYFKNAMQGKSGMTEAFAGKGKVAGRQITVAYSPIYVNEAVVGIITGTYYIDTLSKFLSSSVMNGSGFTFLMNSEGKAVAVPIGRENLLNKTVQQIFTDGVSQLDDESISHTVMGSEKVAVCASKVGTLNMTVVSVTEEDVLDDTMNPIAGAAVLFLIKMIIAFVLCWVAIFAYMRSITREMEFARRDLEHITDSIPGGVRKCDIDDDYRTLYVSDGFLKLLHYDRENDVQLSPYALDIIIEPDRTRVEHSLALPGKEKRNEYRIKRADGEIIWVADNGCIVTEKDGRAFYYSVLTDITDAKNTEMSLRISNQRNQIAISHVADKMFEIDLSTNTLCPISLMRGSGRIPAVIDNIPSALFEMNIIPPEYVTDVERMYTSIKEGEAMASRVLEINLEGTPKWFRLTLSCVYDDGGKAVQAIGTISDVSRDIEAREALKRRAERDVLTGLYNRAALQEKFNAVIRAAEEDEEFVHALIMIDLDGFKQINDTCGHIAGDRVLAEFSKRLASLFRQSDTVARLGGDEFVVFMNNAHSMEIVARKAQQICDVGATVRIDEMPDLHLTCSAGVCMVRNEGKLFEDYYKRSDSALYAAKTEGKARYVIVNFTPND